MKDKLYFVGGVKGVGKTSLINELRRNHKIGYINTGDLVRNYRRMKKEDKQITNSVDLFIFNNLIFLKDSIVDTHFAGRTENGDYVKGLDDYFLNALSLKKNIELVLVTASVDDIYERRAKDVLRRERILDKSDIEREIHATNYFIMNYAKIINKKPYFILNNDFNQAYNELEKIIINPQ